MIEISLSTLYDPLLNNYVNPRYRSFALHFTLTSLKVIGLLHGKAKSFLGAQLQIRDDRIGSQGSIVLVHAMHTYLESLTVNKLSFLPRYRLTYLVII